MKKLFSILFVAVMMFGCNSVSQQEETRQKPEIRFKDGKLKIAQFTDVHWSKGECDVRIPQIIKSVVASENPDILIFTGDVVTGMPVVEGWTKFVNLMHEIGLPYAVTMGNHDPETQSTSDPEIHWGHQETRDTIFTILEKSSLFIGERGPAELQGMGNYVVPVLASDGSDKVGGVLYCMDSYDYSDDVRLPESYGWFSSGQIQWYREHSQEFTAANGGEPVPSLAFFHIPLPEYAKIKSYKRTLGHRLEGVYSGDVNSGMFYAMFEMKDVMGVFVGHDHNNDYVGQFAGIALAYGKATGPSTYGDYTKGGRIITMYEGQHYFDTWLRDEAGEKTDVYYYPSGISDEEIVRYETHPAQDASPKEKGISYRYYEGPFASVKDFESKGKVIEEGVTQSFDITGAKAVNHFGYEFDSWFHAPESDLYEFYLVSDDGAVLTVDGEVVIDLDGSHSVKQGSGSIRLEKGFHDLELRYFEDTEGQKLAVRVMSRRITDFDDVLYVK